ncbi:MAG: hypothetical protein JO200_03245 [Comamonas sp.]|nr:hypothetical protein [Comamonas sp.]
MSSLVPAQQQLFQVERQIEFDGVEMGVLENGMPFLSESGLARMCGIDRKVLNRLASNWDDEKHKPRGRQIGQLLEVLNYFEPALFLRCEHNGSPTNAYTEPVCLALLEYYAFESDEPRPEAQRAFRTLARTSFRTFIYRAVGYTPEQKALDSWKHYHDRIDMTANSVPNGFFGVFQEIAVMIVPMIRSGVYVSDRVVPDISVGKAWSQYWESHGCTAKYGERTRYPHSYPDYYPQSKSNPQPSFAYPMNALGEFRNWLQSNYVATKFPTYILGQAKKGTIDSQTAKLTLSAFEVSQIELKK